MKILYLTATNSLGAGNRVLLSWIDYLLNKGYDIAACCPSGGPLSFSLRKKLKNKLFHCDFYSKDYVLSIRNIVISLVKSLFFSFHFKPNIIHCNSEITYTIFRYISKLLKIPVCVHIRYHFHANFYSWLFKRNFVPHNIFFVSKALLDEELPKLPSIVKKSSMLTVLHNCLSDPLNDIQADSHVIFNKKIYLGCFGPIQKRKNQEALVYLASKFKEHGLPVVILIAGFVRDFEYYDYLSSLIKEYKVLNYIHFCGHLDNVFPVMKSMYINLSVSFYETFGVSVLESMALGVPVVAFDVPALREVMSNTGLIIPQGDISSLFLASKKLITETKLRDELGRKARARYLKNFVPEVIVPKLEDIYRKLI